VLQRTADRDDLLDRRPAAQAPQLADELLARMAPVVGHERDALARPAQGVDGLDRPRRGVLADPHAAVEVEQDVVVAGDEWGEDHSRMSILPPRCAA
jgi:hypothetical protein